MRQAKLVESLQIIFSSYSYVIFTSINSPTYPIQLFCRTLVSILLALNFPKLNIQILESRRLSFMPFILFKFDSGSVGNQFNRTDPCNFYKCLCAHITADLSSSCFQTSDIIQRLTDLWYKTATFIQNAALLISLYHLYMQHFLTCSGAVFHSKAFDWISVGSRLLK